VASCALCQRVSDAATVATEVGSDIPPLDIEQLLATTQQQLKTERGVLAWLRSRRRSLQMTFGICMALLPVALQLVFARRGDLDRIPIGWLLGVAVAYGVAIAYATTVLLAPLYRPTAPRRVWIAALLALAVPIAVLVTNHAPLGSGFGIHDWKAAYACLRYGAFLAIPSLVLVLAMDRTASRRRGIALLSAALGGAVGNFVLLLHCANRETSHQLLGHATIGLALLGLIAAAGALSRISPLR
jgi:hypothetical protein